MAHRRRSRINRENYREEIDLLLEGIQRSHAGWEATKASNAEGIGNLMREFGEAGAEDWFRKAVNWYRQAYPEPSLKLALTLWKLGDRSGLGRTLAEIVTLHRDSLQTIESGVPAPAPLIRAFQETAGAQFMQGAYDEATVTAERGVDAGCEAGRPYIQRAIRDMSKGLLGSDRELFQQGMSALEVKIREWPTAGSGLHEDLYRYSLVLLEQRF